MNGEPLPMKKIISILLCVFSFSSIVSSDLISDYSIITSDKNKLKLNNSKIIFFGTDPMLIYNGLNKNK